MKLKKKYLCLSAVVCSLILFSGCTASPQNSGGVTDDNSITKASASPKVSDTPKVSEVPKTTDSTETTQQNQTEGTNNTISEEQAKKIALEHAGLSESDITFLPVKLDYEDGKQIYEIEFYSGEKEYDYEVALSDGTILSYDYDAENYSIKQKDNYIGDTAAKEAALSHAGLSESDITSLRVKLDTDDGKTTYEVEFYKGNAEYDYEIDAISGEILSYDKDTH